MPSTSSPPRITFGLFEVDLQAGELWRSGYRVKLQSQPFKVLSILLERPGEVVTREELQARLWGSNTIVDFDHSLATAINKIREALRDSADNPRFVETLARRGYRFIAPVTQAHDEWHEEPSGTQTEPLTPSPESQVPADLSAGTRLIHLEPDVVAVHAPAAVSGSSAPTASTSSPTPTASNSLTLPLLGNAGVAEAAEVAEAPRLHGVPEILLEPEVRTPSHAIQPVHRRTSRWALWVTASLAGLFLLALGYLVGLHRAPEVPPHIEQLTHSGHLAVDLAVTENPVASATDGYRLFLPIIEGGQAGVATVPVAGGAPTTFSVPKEVANPMLGDISPDGTQLLLRNHLSPESEQPLWVVPVSGDSALRVDSVLAHDATWMPDGKGILYASGNDLYLTHMSEGRQPQRYASLPGRAFWLRWSPSGQLLRFTIVDPIAHTKTLWELTPSDRTPRQILKGFVDPPLECCGVWTADGKWFVFQSTRNGATDLWKLSGNSTSHPIRVTDGPLEFESPLTSRTGHTLYFIGVDSRSQMERLTATGVLVPERGMLASAVRVEFSRDGKWAVWTDHTGRLWRSTVDGTERLQLTPDSMDVFLARWSPDGKKIAFMARDPGEAWRLYTVAADGGEIQPLLRESRNAADPSWSADGKTIVFGRVNDPLGKENAARTLQLLHLDTGAVEALPDSVGLFSPRWSPDGRYIAALSLDQRQVKLFNVATQQWSTLPVHSGADPVWSPDSRFLYVHESLDPAQSVDRIAVPSGAVQQLIRLNDASRGDVQSYVFAGLTDKSEPLIVEQTFTGNMYSLDLK